MDNELITIQEAERLAGVSKGAITHAITAGRVTAFPLPEAHVGRGNRTRLVLRADVLRLRSEQVARLNRKSARLLSPETISA